MSIRKSLYAAVAVMAVAAPALAAGPIQIETKVLAEQRSAAVDGTTKVALVSAAKVTPGDRVVYQIAYQNTGSQPVSDIVISNPVPRDVAYLAPAAGSPEPELSVDGSTFAPIATLRVHDAKGGFRPASTSDVKAVRWRLTKPLAAGGHGVFAYRAVLK